MIDKEVNGLKITNKKSPNNLKSSINSRKGSAKCRRKFSKFSSINERYNITILKIENNTSTKSKDHSIKDEPSIIEYVRESRLNERNNSNINQFHL